MREAALSTRIRKILRYTAKVTGHKYKTVKKLYLGLDKPERREFIHLCEERLKVIAHCMVNEEEIPELEL